MASFGLYDWDMNYWRQPVVFNLELMKIGAYLISEKHLVKMLKEFQTDRYKKVYLQKDYSDGVFPSEIFLDPKTIFNGRAFSSERKYVPLETQIEEMRPSTNFYRGFLEYFSVNKRTEDLYKSMIGAPHLRISLDGKTIWEKWGKTFSFSSVRNKTVYLHDYNLGKIENPFPVFEELTKTRTVQKFIYNKFPIQLMDNSSLEKWSSVKYHSAASGIISKKVPTDEELYYFMSGKSGVRYSYEIKSPLNEDDWIRLFYHILFFKENKIIFNILFPENLRQEEINLCRMFSAMTNQNVLSRTFYEYCKTLPSPFFRKDIVSAFSYAQKTYPNLFKLFYELEVVRFKNNIFQKSWEV